MNDIKILEENGLDIDNGYKMVNVKDSISYIVADNLGANKVGGFVESFNNNVNCYCRFCYSTPELVQEKFRDTDFDKLDELNEKLSKFNYGRIDMKNKVPCTLFAKQSLKTNYGFKLSATHAWMLIKVFPLIYGKEFQDDEHYDHFVDLIEIYRDLNGSNFNENTIKSLETRIENYLKTSTIYYKITFTAKHHFMVHVGRTIREFGPPKQYSIMRFGSKHSYFKRANQRIHNSINTTKSLSERHQDFQLYNLKSPNYFKPIEYGPESKMNPIYPLIKELRGQDLAGFNGCSIKVGASLFLIISGDWFIQNF
ncbi:hypothetical protein BpHYR1_006237 [Brachionus plicatilis]|uniref:Uncharacterized protein n=1 Tax=Brachionus plicatilis TaxID=10195 RepID=A0A3M7SB11_BRAPC|nr:hypothetical protein BpHYR1_006237 [Brachionus plicatilis]